MIMLNINALIQKNKNILIGDGIGSLIQMAMPFIKNVAPKVLGTLGLASLSAATSNAINKSINKNEHIIKLFDKELDIINKNLDKINKSKVFQKKIILHQKGSGMFSFLLPILVSTIIPSIIKGKGNNIF